MLALILAGGKGLRLAPYTRVLPKPLLPVGERPVLAILLDRLRMAGVTKAVIALGYLGELIQTYFSDGSRIGMEISYLIEKEPLGTAGPMALLPQQERPFLMVNGDILTDLSFADLYRAHQSGDAAVTVAAILHQCRFEYGCLRVEEGRLVAWEEKPVWRGLISIGAYVLSPGAQALCPRSRTEMPGMLDLLLRSGHKISVYQSDAYWRDIGVPEEYLAVNQYPPAFVKNPKETEG